MDKKVEDSYSPFNTLCKSPSRKDFKGSGINERHLLHEQSAVFETEYVTGSPVS